MKKVLNKLRKTGFSVTCLDIGARGGFNVDLLPIASIISAIGFEPDRKECDLLNQRFKNHFWKSLKYLPTALGTGNMHTLKLYRQRGCSSLLEANQELAKLFSRGDYYIYDDQIEVPVMPMDEAAKKFGFEKASYIKIDIQGAELDVFISGKNLLSKSVVGIRIEVSFLPMYKNQPVFSDIDAFLNKLGFNLMNFIEQHHWRRSTKIKYPFPSLGKYSLSRGQLAHGDALYLRMPENMPSETEEDRKKLLELALISLAYGYIDHAKVALYKEGMPEYLKKYNLEAGELLNEFSNKLKKENRISLMKSIALNVKLLVKNII